MLVTCPKCSARYEVPPEISLKTGQKVQCSACEYVFELAPVAEETAPSVNLLPPEDAVLSINAKTEEIIVHTHEPEPEPVLDQKARRTRIDKAYDYPPAVLASFLKEYLEHENEKRSDRIFHIS